MDWLRLLVASSVLLATTLPLSANAELETRGVLDPSIKGFRFYKRPKVVVPVGWIIDEDTSSATQTVFLVRGGADPNAALVSIYGMAVRNQPPIQTLESFVRGDVGNFIKKSEKGTAKKIPNAIETTRRFIWYQYSYLFEGKRFYQTAAFTKEGDYFLSFGLTGKTKEAHDSGLTIFKQMVAAYK